jgi:hypothetical protein
MVSVIFTLLGATVPATGIEPVWRAVAKAQWPAVPARDASLSVEGTCSASRTEAGHVFHLFAALGLKRA